MTNLNIELGNRGKSNTVISQFFFFYENSDLGHITNNFFIKLVKLIQHFLLFWKNIQPFVTDSQAPIEMLFSPST